MLTTTTNPFTTMTNPAIQLINMALGPALLVVGALGAIYCVFLGVKLAKAEEPQEREKAKSALKNAIIGFVLIFVLLVALRVGLPAMTSWSNSVAPTPTGAPVPTGAGTN
jgi:threonine/homoserine/homoserine lactone efflux protein